MNKKLTYAFFGTGALAESVLAALVKHGHMPDLVVTKPDSMQGRHMQMVPPHIKTWSQIKGITVYQPDSLKEIPSDSPLHTKAFDIFIVASYGKIIPDEILHLAAHGALNVHPSLLPKYRGPSPIESVLLSGDMTTGVTIIKLDSQMDHGPILAQNAFTISPYANAGTLEVTSGQLGGEMLTAVLSHYLDGSLIPKEQHHAEATICKKISKDMGLVTLDDDITTVRRKFRAFNPWPTLYFFITHAGKDIRIKINDIEMLEEKEERSLRNYVLSVTPEGKKQMDYESFVRGYMQH